jgi:CPA1 family monovalent cation:H+ antiporter
MCAMETVVLVLAMLLAVVTSGYLVRILPFSMPLPLVQVAMGAVIAGVFKSGLVLDPEVFFLLFLPPLLFLDGWRIPNYGLLRDKATILELALGLVVFTVIGLGFLIHWMIPAMPLPVAFALAAIVSPTDALAVTSIASRTPLPKRLLHILQGESLLNDASGLVCFRFAVAVAMTGTFSLASASLTLLWLAVAGVGIGVAVTLVVTTLQMALSGRFGEENGTPILVNLLLPFGAYLLAEQTQASGILAAVAAGITMSYVELSGRAPPSTRVDRAAVWDTAQFALNGAVFVLLGEQLPGILRGAVTSVAESGQLNPWWLAAYAALISLGLGLLRFTWVWVSLRLTHIMARRRGESVTAPHWRLIAAASLAGVRGAITLAGVMTLPLALPDGHPFPARELAVFLATSVILVSLVVASIGLPHLLRGLELREEQTERLAEERARRDAAIAAIAAIQLVLHDPDRSAADADVQGSAAGRVIARYQRRLDGGTIAGTTAEHRRKEVLAERALLLAGLHAEREKIFALARESRISDEISRKLVREVDLVESRYR